MDIERVVATARQAWRRTGDLWLAAGCFVAALALYVQTLAPSVATIFDDSLEFPLVSYRLAIAHPTGYPLHTLLGKLFTLGPWGDAARSVNLLSAVAGALTVTLVYLVIRQLTQLSGGGGGRRLPALLGALALAVSPVFWSQAVIAEVYTLNSVFLAAVLWLALYWARRPLVPVKPFSLLLTEPGGRKMVFLPGQGIGSRLPPALRRVAQRAGALYRRAFPAVPPSRRLQLHPAIYGLAALYGLSLTHHRLMLLLAPALFLFVLAVEPRVFSRAALLGPEHPDRSHWLQIVGHSGVLVVLSFLAPLLLYLYLPIRGSTGSLDGAYANTWSGFWRWVATGGYGVFLGDNPLARDLDAAHYARLFWQQFGPVGLALAVTGIVGLLLRPSRGLLLRPSRGRPVSVAGAYLLSGRKALLLTGLAFVAYVVFAAGYRVPDVEVFFTPAFVLVAVWIGAGLDYAAGLLRPRGRSLAVRRLLAIGRLLLFLAAVAQPLAIAASNYPDLDRSQEWAVHDYGRYLLQQELPANSTIVGLLGETTLLRYFQATEGLGPGVETIAANDEAARRAAVDAALAEGRAVFITQLLPGLADAYSLDAVTGATRVDGELTTLVRVGEPSGEVPELPRPADLEPVPGLQLLGYGLRSHGDHGEVWVRLRLWWRAPQGMAGPLKVSARLVDPSGQLAAATDIEPVARTYPATAWRAGEVVADAYEIHLPAGTPPDEYRPLVIVYDPATGAEYGRAELEPVYLAGSPARPPRRALGRALEASVGQTVYARFGDVELLGYTPPDPGIVYRPGDSLPLTLLWQAQGQPRGDLRVDFWLEGVEEYPAGAEPVGGRYPVSQWRDGQVVRQQPALQVLDAPPGRYQLKMRVTRDGQPVPWSRGWIPLGSDLTLGPVWIEP